MICDHRLEKGACLTVEDLYSIWQDGENKLQMIISVLSSECASMKEAGRRTVGTVFAQLQQTDGADKQTRWSDNEPDTGGSNEVEPVTEEADTAPSGSQKAVPKQQQKSKKKPKKSKGRGKK